MRILVLKPSSLGDVVQALPVLRLLKQAQPAAEVYWWLESSLQPLLEGDPDLAGIVPFARRTWRLPAAWWRAWQGVRRLRALRFDWVIDLQSLLRSGLVAWIADGAFTVGLDDPREGAGAFYDRAVPRPSPATHAVDWYLQVLPALGVPVHRRFVWLPPRPAVAVALSEQWGWPGRRWVVLQPGARWQNKRWPAEYFQAFIARLTAAFGDVHVAVLGGVAEQPLGSFLAAARPDRVSDLTGRTSLPEMVEWIRRAELLVTNDSGPMHVAAALGTPLLGIFGPTDPRRTGPYGQAEAVLQARLSCVPCMKDSCARERPLECLWAITPETVFERAAERLSAGSR